MQCSKLARCCLFAALSLIACKSSAPPAAAGGPKTLYPDISHLTDEELARANQSEGVGIGLRIAGGTFTANQAIPLHLILEDFDASAPIASGLCQGVYVAYENTDNHESGGADLAANSHCFAELPYPDSIPLEKLKPKIYNLEMQRNGHVDLPPGSYLVEIQWQAYSVAPPTIAVQTPYSTIHSNRVHIVVTP